MQFQELETREYKNDPLESNNDRAKSQLSESCNKYIHRIANIPASIQFVEGLQLAARYV